MGKIEEIKEAISGIWSLSSRYIVTYHVSQDTVDILFRELAILIHQENDKTIAAYRILSTWNRRYTFIKGREELARDKKMIIFPCKNIFRLLGIRYSYEPKGYLADLGELCQLIQDNSSQLIEAFSEKNIEKTYHALIALKGNNDEEIQKTLQQYSDYSHPPPDTLRSSSLNTCNELYPR